MTPVESPRRPWLVWLKRCGTAVLILVAALLVAREARSIEWPDVLAALSAYGFTTLASAFAVAVPGLLACACFDLIGRQATGHGLPIPRVMLISFTGYFFSLNLGALIGGLAFRYRLYSPYGLSGMTISQIIGLSVLSNWSGYVLIAGFVLTAAPPDLPAGWGPEPVWLRAAGAALLVVVAAYLLLCALRGGRRVRIGNSTLTVPTLGVAALQFGLSVVSWGTIGGVITALLPGDVSWFTVMPVLMLSAVAGIWSHVPGGLGVTEFVFVTLLGHRIDRNELVAAVLAFRAVYYLLPFVFAIAAYAYLEATRSRARKKADANVA